MNNLADAGRRLRQLRDLKELASWQLRLKTWNERLREELLRRGARLPAPRHLRYPAASLIEEPAASVSAGRRESPAHSSELGAVAYAALAGLLLALIGLPWRRALARPSIKMTLAAAGRRRWMLNPCRRTVNNDVLGLVYAFTPTGSRRSVQQMLGPNPHSAAADSPWVPSTSTPPPRFPSVLMATMPKPTRPTSSVDRLKRSVSASPDTLLNLPRSPPCPLVIRSGASSFQDLAHRMTAKLDGSRGRSCGCRPNRSPHWRKSPPTAADRACSG